jgi:hypothetical protein
VHEVVDDIGLLGLTAFSIPLVNFPPIDTTPEQRLPWPTTTCGLLLAKFLTRYTVRSVAILSKGSFCATK